MTLDEVKCELQNRYQINNFIDLTDFDSLPNSKLYTKLRKCHKTVFNDNERVVFIANTSLKRSFSDLPHDIITVLQQYIQHYDIPHFFIIVLSNIPNIKEELKYVHSKYNPREHTPVTYMPYS